LKSLKHDLFCQIPEAGLEPVLNIKYGFNGTGKIEHFSKVSPQKRRFINKI
jgi:hypothetical protein